MKLEKFFNEYQIKEGTTLEEKADLIKKLTFEDFLKLLFDLHGTFMKVEDSVYETWSAVHGVIKTGGSVLDFEAPENPQECLREAFEDVQSRISIENYKECLASLYSAVLYAHMYEDGNGRMARGMYALLAEEGVPTNLNDLLRLNEGHSFHLGYDKFRSFSSSIVMHGTAEVLKNHGVDCKSGHDLSIANIEDDSKLSLQLETGGQKALGNMAFIQFLAAKKTIEESGRSISLDDKIDLGTFSELEQTRYVKNYKDLLRELYFSIQNLHKEHPTVISEALDQMIFE